MKKTVFLAAAAIALASCSSDELVNSTAGDMNGESPIAFSVEAKNITRGTTPNPQNLEATGHYNFGVWAYKYKEGAATQQVMGNYLVGYSDGVGTGYDNSAVKKGSTWNASAGDLNDHKSPWFYEKLGKEEYKNSDATKGYLATQTEYMSANDYQYLRYWDLAYTNTNFYAYAPYNKNVKFVESTKTMTFDAENTICDGYDEPLNSAYTNQNRSLSEFMYAGYKAENAQKADVIIPFKHMGAQLFVRFYEDIPGYRVEIIDLNEDGGKIKNGITGDMISGIQATPATKSGDTYSLGKYYTKNSATITFNDNADPTFTPSIDGITGVSTPLMFKIPEANLSTKDLAPSNLEDFNGHNVIKEVTLNGNQYYSYSPTIYYPVTQCNSQTGFTFHISYRVIAKDNKEVITVHNATVFVPATGKAKVSDDETSATEKDTSIASWQPNVKYTYTFKITTGSSGTTNPETEIDPTNPTPSDIKGLYPIVFDGATIENYTVTIPETDISEGTKYKNN
jgi:hypothetical protein